MTQGPVTFAGVGTSSRWRSGNCQCSWTNSSGEAICSQADSFQVVIVCTHAGMSYEVDGPWVDRYHVSTAGCHLGDMLLNTHYPYQSVYANVETN